MSESDAPSRPLTQHLDDLYTLAAVLAGADQAEALVTQAYEAAAQTPPRDRPDDSRSWLIRHLLDAHTSTADAGPSAAVRREAARQTAERVLPVAFAACSARERLALTLDVVLNLGPDARAAALDTDPETAADACDAAWASLRASLRDLLTGPERMLIDTALDDDTIRDTLRAHLSTDSGPAPASLRSDVAAVLRETTHTRSPEARSSEAAASSEDTTSPARRRSSPDDRGSSSSSGRSWRRIVLGAASLLLLGAAAYVFTLAVSPTPAPDPSLTTFSAQRVAEVSTPTQTATPAEAVRHLREEWNRRATVPSIAGAALQGVAHLTVAPDLRVPALVYADSTTDGRITIFAYNYALLDRIGDRAALDTDMRDRLATARHPVVRRELDQSLVLWRERDDLFLAVAPHLAPDTLRSRLGL